MGDAGTALRAIRKESEDRMTDKELLKDILPYLKEYFDSENFKEESHRLVSMLEAKLRGIDPLVCNANVKCKGWEQHIKHNKSIEVYDLAHCFKYCPWCGKEIE